MFISVCFVSISDNMLEVGIFSNPVSGVVGIHEVFNMKPSLCSFEVTGRSYGTKCICSSKIYVGLGKSKLILIGVIGKVSVSAFQ